MLEEYKNEVEGRDYWRAAQASRGLEEEAVAFGQLLAWTRREIITTRQMDPRDFLERINRSWRDLMMPTNQTRENVEDFLEKMIEIRGKMYSVGIRDRGNVQHGLDELDDLDRMVPKGSQILQFFLFRAQRARYFKEWCNLVAEWCHNQQLSPTSP